MFVRERLSAALMRHARRQALRSLLPGWVFPVFRAILRQRIGFVVEQGFHRRENRSRLETR